MERYAKRNALWIDWNPIQIVSFIFNQLIKWICIWNGRRSTGVVVDWLWMDVDGADITKVNVMLVKVSFSFQFHLKRSSHPSTTSHRIGQRSLSERNARSDRQMAIWFIGFYYSGWRRAFGDTKSLLTHLWVKLADAYIILSYCNCAVAGARHSRFFFLFDY